MEQMESKTVSIDEPISLSFRRGNAAVTANTPFDIVSAGDHCSLNMSKQMLPLASTARRDIKDCDHFKSFLKLTDVWVVLI